MSIVEKYEEHGWRSGLWIVSEVAAANWLVLELTGNGVLEMVGLTDPTLGTVHMVVGFAGLVALANDLS